MCLFFSLSLPEECWGKQNAHFFFLSMQRTILTLKRAVLWSVNRKYVPEGVCVCVCSRRSGRNSWAKAHDYFFALWSFLASSLLTPKNTYFVLQSTHTHTSPGCLISTLCQTCTFTFLPSLHPLHSTFSIMKPSTLNQYMLHSPGLCQFNGAVIHHESQEGHWKHRTNVTIEPQSHMFMQSTPVW